MGTKMAEAVQKGVCARGKAEALPRGSPWADGERRAGMSPRLQWAGSFSNGCGTVTTQPSPHSWLEGVSM